MKSILFYTIVFIIYFALKQVLYHPTGPKINVFDIGQGDAILITTKNYKRILIDGGPSFDIDRYLDLEMPFGSCNLDVVILTHPHFDHYFGLEREFERCNVKKFYANNIPVSLKSKFPTPSSLLTGHYFDLDGVRFEALSPNKNFVNNTNPNDQSIVLLFRKEGFAGLLMGDAELVEQMSIDINKIPSNINFYKAAHHGSINGTYSKLLRKAKPYVSVISSGIGNPYGHPHAEALKVLGNVSSYIYRTDMDGTFEMAF